MTLPNDPNAAAQPPAQQQQQQGNGQQTDYQTAYTNLMAQLQDPNGPYVQRNVYTGLQRTLQEKHDAHERATTALTESTQRLTTMQQQLEALNTATSSAQAEKGRLETELNAAKNRIARFELIGKDFPALISWEAQGLLPQAPIDQLPATLQLIATQLESKQQQGKQQNLMGANLLGTQDPNTAVTVTAAAKLQEYNQAVLAGKPKGELQTMWKDYQELKAKEGK